MKQHHPDANGGDRSTEDRLIEIIKAYNYLKTVVRGLAAAAYLAVVLRRRDDSGDNGSAVDSIKATVSRVTAGIRPT